MQIVFDRATSLSVFELRLGREPLAAPFGIGQCVVVGDMRHGMFLTSLDRGARALGVPPVSALRVTPPLVMIVERNCMIWRTEYN
jgi:hypothetical protein